MLLEKEVVFSDDVERIFGKRIKDIKREQAEAEKKAQQAEAEQSAEPATEEQKSVVSYNLTSSESEAEATNTEQSNE